MGPDRASARRLAHERMAKWRKVDETIWPPPPKRAVDPTGNKPERRGSSGALAAFGVVFVSAWALLMGVGAGIGHKDFSESLASNVGIALFDMGLWSLAILYWIGIAKKEWQTLKVEPRPLRAVAFYVPMALLVLFYGAGICFSLMCLVSRAAASDTTF